MINGEGFSGDFVPSRAVGSAPTMRVCSIIVPCRNEGKILDRKLENTYALHAPGWRLEILIVDDHSDDDTARIAEMWATRYPDRIIALCNLRAPGKANTVAAALALATGEIYATTDADVTMLSTDLTDALIHFLNPAVGAVFGSQRDTDVKRGDPRASELSYRSSYEVFRDALRKFENRFDSTVVPHGQFFLIRKATAVQPRSEVRADDVDLALCLRRSGYRVDFEPRLTYLEYRERNPVALNAVFERRAAAGIELFLHSFSEFFMRRKYGFFGLVSFPLEFSLYCAQPLLVFALLGAALWSSLWYFGWPGLPLTVAVSAAVGLTFQSLSHMEWLLIKALAKVLWKRGKLSPDRWLNEREAP